ncbi:MAG: hypothetical protein IT372_26870 [Polyangiaceae bacterium]|nr:hypothetical protein [Polyangiaceae bacterium]
MIRAGRSAHALATIALLACAEGACRRKTEDPPPPPAPSATAPRPPVDAVLPGELAEGSELAFGLPIPRRMRVRARFPDEVSAAGDVPPERLSNYVRERVLSPSVETGPAKTVFAKATVKKAPERTLRIEVVAHPGATELIVRDLTPPPAVHGLSEEERWRRKGLKPDGSPLDPTRLE